MNSQVTEGEIELCRKKEKDLWHNYVMLNELYITLPSINGLSREHPHLCNSN